MKLFLFFLFSLICISNSFTHNFIEFNTKFNGISLNKGIRHLHMPEHIKYTHLIGAPLFNIHSVSHPIHYNNITNIYFTCSVMNLHKMFVRMHTKNINSCEMNFYINQKEFITLLISLSPDLNNKNNHYFNLKVFTNKELLLFLPIIKILFQISMFISITEDKLLFFNNNNHKNLKFIPNFNKYRKLIFHFNK